jgi:hypothetical protein
MDSKIDIPPPINPFLTMLCPHCRETIYIEKDRIQCGIFRHGFLPPHASKAECERALSSGKLIEGCAKPFQILFQNGHYNIQTCDYI